MKKGLLFICFIALSVSGISAQKYDPTTNWPYLYEHFQEGTIYFADNSKIKAKVNVHMLNSVLHYLKGELIYQIEPKDLIRVDIGDKYFIYVDNTLARIVHNSGVNLVTSITKGDFEALFRSSGAYGMSSTTSATRDLSSLEIGGLANNNHTTMMIEKENGKVLPLRQDYFLIIDGVSYSASKRALERELPDPQKQKLKEFLKANRMKWKDEKMLSDLIDYLVK